MEYSEFLNSKVIKKHSDGFEISLDEINRTLFDFQRAVVKWACEKGRAALFEGCGDGKSFQQIEWARLVNEYTEKPVLIVAPLGVIFQTIREGKKIGVEINEIRNSEQSEGIDIINYDMLEKIDISIYSGVVLDESSILKSFMGKTKRAIMEMFAETPYKLSCTATPAPNGLIELLNQADFLGIMKSSDALTRWFINDTTEACNLRLKKHAKNEFWKWVASWAVIFENPSEIGFEQCGYDLPELIEKEIFVSVDQTDFDNGKLFKDNEISATDFHREMRRTMKARSDKTAEIVNTSTEQWIVWVEHNDESDYLQKAIPGSVQVKGSDSEDKKKSVPIDFVDGKIRVIISKSSIFGFGMNFQHCHNVIYNGISFSFEGLYQSLRRVWRYGQKQTVNAYYIFADSLYNVLSRIHKKREMNENMRASIIEYMKKFNELKGVEMKLDMNYNKNEIQIDGAILIQGDSVEEIKNIPDNSVHFQIFSPPFSNQYTYSSSYRDMGNCSGDDDFIEHFKFLIPELHRILIPGRLCAVHCKNMVKYKSKWGRSALRDLRGEIVRAFMEFDFEYHSEVVIWKDPVREMQRTKTQGLLHKQVKKDATYSRNGLAEYLVIFRKWDGLDGSGEAVSHDGGFDFYIGEDMPETSDTDSQYDKDGYSISVWQRYASPVWFDIRQTNVLNKDGALHENDEKHICPLQLDVIGRAIHLWTNPGDVVFTPFMGIGSEVYQALKMGRRGIGIELKKEYFEKAVSYCRGVEEESKTLFDEVTNE